MRLCRIVRETVLPGVSAKGIDKATQITVEIRLPARQRDAMRQFREILNRTQPITVVSSYMANSVHCSPSIFTALGFRVTQRLSQAIGIRKRCKCGCFSFCPWNEVSRLTLSIAAIKCTDEAIDRITQYKRELITLWQPPNRSAVLMQDQPGITHPLISVKNPP
ncbi:hypothetical protein A3754_08295 [Alcanivorax sp. HI0083]|nr:hypothetical protein A3730_15555 [Alcanivorax sp. HI0044]KZZ27245.1 hypothetical protein A3754_08295 [Alcanivorax sp. HI0083]